MKNNKFFYFAVAAMALLAIMFSSCERVEPNYVGVLMEDYGKNGKEDFSLTKGRVWTMSPGTELYQVPLYIQRADFEDRTLHLKAADNTEFESKPMYSYTVIEERAIDVVFQNKHLGSGDDFMRSLENNVLEPRIYDVMKEESRRYVTDTLMSNGGSLKFEKRLEDLLKQEFNELGLTLESFSGQLEFSKKVKDKINQRNEVNTNVSVIDQQIIEQKKRNELAELKAQENLIISKGITEELLMQQFIEKWDGKTPLYGETPLTFFKTVK